MASLVLAGLLTPQIPSTPPFKLQGRAKQFFAIHTCPPERLECHYFYSDSDFFLTTGSSQMYPAQVPDQLPSKDTQRRMLLGHLNVVAESVWM